MDWLFHLIQIQTKPSNVAQGGWSAESRPETISNVDQRSSPTWLKSLFYPRPTCVELSAHLGRTRGTSLPSHCLFLNWKLDQRLWRVATHHPWRAHPHTPQPDLSSPSWSQCLSCCFSWHQKKTVIAAAARTHQETSCVVSARSVRLLCRSWWRLFFIWGRQLCLVRYQVLNSTRFQ